jgi:hypothetical protein
MSRPDPRLQRVAGDALGPEAANDILRAAARIVWCWPVVGPGGREARTAQAAPPGQAPLKGG